MNSQKLIVLVLLIDMLFAGILLSNAYIETSNQNLIDTGNEKLENILVEYGELDPKASSDPDYVQNELTPYSNIGLGTLVSKFFSGIKIVSNPLNSNDGLEYYLNFFTNIFILIINALLIFELYLILKNKKGT